jgi:hypothetical protein
MTPPRPTRRHLQPEGLTLWRGHGFQFMGWEDLKFHWLVSKDGCETFGPCVIEVTE